MIKKYNKEIGFIYKNENNIDKIYKNNQLVFEQGFYREDSGSTPLTTSHEAIGKNLKGYKVYGNSRQNNLPDGYTEVEYIESTGTQYINIPFDNTNVNKNKYYYKYMHRDAISKSSTILGNASGYNRIGMLWFRTNNTTRMSIGSVTSPYSTFNVNTVLQQQLEVIVEVDNINNEYSVNYNGNKYNNISFSGSSKTNSGIKILNSGSGTSQASNIVLYNIKIWNDDTLIRNFVPCYRKLDDVIGMYDTVNDIFYTNDGAGIFIKGNNVTPTSSNPIPIESVGDLVTDSSDTNYGKYKIPVSDGINTTNMYLNEPLRKVGNYADYIDYKEQKVYRNVIVNDDSGEQTIENSYSGTTDTTGTSVTLPNIPSLVGTTTYDVDTKVKPSNMYIKYKGR